MWVFTAPWTPACSVSEVPDQASEVKQLPGKECDLVTVQLDDDLYDMKMINELDRKVMNETAHGEMEGEAATGNFLDDLDEKEAFAVEMWLEMIEAALAEERRSHVQRWRQAKVEEAERAADEARRKEREAWQKAEQEKEAKARREAVSVFLKNHGFSSVTSSKRGLRKTTGALAVHVKTTYPLHEAAKQGNAQMVRLLLEEGADKLQQNSQGLTAFDFAKETDVDGSHTGVLRLLAYHVEVRGGA
eukprot:TRINITY_DN21238_c0_g1_i1.p1 TRINITY_DN21238_c0_g1~~TRINITY_DN21238_c0_g1_i1.p1  ORF type:complete len:246 (+),score=95.93 TRINITY_DN21238_c0_g1_i1:141-878(+)